MDDFSLSLPISTRLDRMSPALVTRHSPLFLRNAVHRFARYFRHEMHFDSVDFDPSESASGSTPYEAWVFHSPATDRMFEDKPLPFRMFGACCFHVTEEPARATLRWVWLHPFFRGRGHLTQAWPLFRYRYGDFDIERPLSPAMAEFVRRKRD